MADGYEWTDNPTVSGVSECDTDVLNDCLMHLKYDTLSSGFGLLEYKDTNQILQGSEAIGWLLQGVKVTETYPNSLALINEEWSKGKAATDKIVISITENIEIPYKVFKRGLKIVDIQFKDLTDELFENTGVNPYFIYDEQNKFFYLPYTELSSNFILRYYKVSGTVTNEETTDIGNLVQDISGLETNKVNVNAKNFTDEGKIQLVTLGKSSNINKPYDVGPSESVITAPANGKFNFFRGTNAPSIQGLSRYVKLHNLTTGERNYCHMTTNNSGNIGTSITVKKSDEVKYGYERGDEYGSVISQELIFIYDVAEN